MTDATGFQRFTLTPLPCPLAYPEGMVYHARNCGVVACAIAANVPYAVASEWHRLNGNGLKGEQGSFNGNWRGITYHKRYGAFLSAMGVWFKQEDLRKSYTRLPTAERFVRRYCRPGVMYLIRVKGHALCYKDGWFIDQYRIAMADEFPGRKRKVTDVWEIVS